MMKALRFSHRFRFADEKLTNRLIRSLLEWSIPFGVDAAGEIHFRTEDEEQFEDALAVVRGGVFPAWQVLSFPKNSMSRYRAELKRRQVKFREEWADGSVEFLMSQEHQPHSWTLDRQPLTARGCG